MWDGRDGNFTVKMQVPPVELVHLFHGWFASRFLDRVVCERYDITPDTLTKGRNRDPYHLEGWLRLECEANEVPFFQVGRSNAKHFASDTKLQRMEWYVKGMNHANDAMRQVVTHLAGADRFFTQQLADGTR